MIDRDFEALIAFIESRQATPHEWGRKANDCIAFAGHAVEAVTDGHRQPLKGLHWHDRASGLKLLAKLGGVEAALDARFQRIAPAQAHRGDIAGVADADFGMHPMIVEGEYLVGPGAKGNRRLPRRAMVAAWNVTSPPPKRKRKKA